MIQIHNLNKSFGNQQVLKSVHLTISEGCRLFLVGASGSGKSVLLKLMLGLLKADSGEILIDGQSIAHLHTKAWNKIRDQFGVVFQSSALFDSLNIGENVGLKLVERRQANSSEIQERVLNALEEVGLEASVVDKFPAELSGGMRKRVAIARAIIHKPRYLIYDEPTTGLDPVSAGRIDGLIDRLAREKNRSSIVVSHDLTSMKQVASEIAMLYQGKICFQGSPDSFFSSSQSEVRAFLQRGLPNAQALGR